MQVSVEYFLNLLCCIHLQGCNSCIWLISCFQVWFYKCSPRPLPSCPVTTTNLCLPSQWPWHLAVN